MLEWVFSWSSGFLPQSVMQAGLTVDSNSHLSRRCECERECLSVAVRQPCDSLAPCPGCTLSSPNVNPEWWFYFWNFYLLKTRDSSVVQSLIKWDAWSPWLGLIHPKHLWRGIYYHVAVVSTLIFNCEWCHWNKLICSPVVMYRVCDGKPDYYCDSVFFLRGRASSFVNMNCYQTRKITNTGTVNKEGWKQQQEEEHPAKSAFRSFIKAKVDILHCKKFCM